MDIEMSGLDPEVNTILEIATVITDYNLELVSEGPVIAVNQSDAQKIVKKFNQLGENAFIIGQAEKGTSGVVYI